MKADVYTVRPEDEWSDDAKRKAQGVADFLSAASSNTVEIVPYVKCADGVYRPEAQTEQFWPETLP